MLPSLLTDIIHGLDQLHMLRLVPLSACAGWPAAEIAEQCFRAARTPSSHCLCGFG
jgi:hypothetical protein